MPTGIYQRKPMSEETKKKIGQANKISLKGRKLDVIHRLHIGLGQLGRKKNREECLKISQKLLGHLVSQQTRNKISKNQKKRFGKDNPFFGKNHSEKSKKKISLSKIGLTGEKCGNWKGGITSIHRLLRGSIKSRLWRKSVLERDNYTCQKKGINNNKLHSHHILNFSNYPELQFDINNGITLSKESHIEFHKIYGIKNNTKEQLEEFIGRKI